MAVQNVKKIKPGCNFCYPWKEFADIAKNNHAVAIICDTAKSWGHSMIIPFEHSSNLASGMEEKIWQKGIIPLLREVIEKFKKNPQVIGFHINSNAGREAGQYVFHTHIHVVPIYQKDKGNWINFLNKEFTGQGVEKINGWDDSYQLIQSHIKDCLDQKLLKRGGPDEFGSPVWHFNLFAYIGNGSLDNQEHFWIVPKTGTSDYRWNGGANCKGYNFVEREKIAEKIKNERWEEESTEKLSTPKKDKSTGEPTKNNDNQQPNQNGENHNQNPHPPGRKNEKGQSSQDPEKGKRNDDSSDRDEENNKDGSGGQKPSNDNGSDNNLDQQKKKNNPSVVIPSSIKQYFKKYNVQKIELDGENWIITYKNKKENKIIPVANVPEIQDLKNYLQSQGIISLDASSFETNLSSSKPNEVKYWPWILGIGGILVIGGVVWIFRKKSRKIK